MTAKPFTGAADLAAMLARQLVEPVQWEATLLSLLSQGKRRLYELGPGAQIKAMVKRIDIDAWKAMQNISV